MHKVDGVNKMFVVQCRASLMIIMKLCEIAMNWSEGQLLKIIKWVCKCGIKLTQQFNKQWVNISDDFFFFNWFCSISSRKIVSNSHSWAGVNLHLNTLLYRLWINFIFKWIKWVNDSITVHKDSHLLHSWLIQPFKLINWMNNSVIKSVTCRHLLSVLF